MPKAGDRGSAEERFWKKAKGSADPNVCWLWHGATNDAGYGQLSVDGKLEYAHRFSFRTYKRSLRSGEIVLHSCDTPACINPNHLFAGTHQENTDDKINKGRDRKARGKDHPSVRLTEDKVREIDQLLRQGTTQRGIAAQYGVAHTTIEAIAIGRSWKHVTGR